MDPAVALTFLDSCIGWVGALCLIVVGGLVAAKDDKGAGLAIIVAGAIKLLLNCCAMSPSLAFSLGFYDIPPSLFDTNLVLIQLQRLFLFGLLAFGLTRLASKPDVPEVSQ